jgi:hypothetical protein
MSEEWIPDEYYAVEYNVETLNRELILERLEK